jgi:hypothetical protein
MLVAMIGVAGCGAEEATEAERAATTAVAMTEAQAEPTPAEQLAVIETGSEDAALAQEFQGRLDALGDKCENPERHLADFTVTSQQQLQERGIDESLLSILTNVNRSIPDDFSQEVDCAEIFAAYITLRMGG